MEHAKEVSEFWLENLAADYVTKWDYAAPGPTFKDTSAAYNGVNNILIVLTIWRRLSPFAAAPATSRRALVRGAHGVYIAKTCPFESMYSGVHGAARVP